MRKIAILSAALLLAACSAQTIAHQPYTPRRISESEFKPIIIPQLSRTYPVISDNLPTVEIPTELPTKTQPQPKPKSVIKYPAYIVPTSKVKQYALSRVGKQQFACLDILWRKESGWRYNAYNASSGAYGIPQALPGKKMASAGSDWRTNPITQVKWGLNYISNRYGSACKAWSFWKTHHWY